MFKKNDHAEFKPLEAIQNKPFSCPKCGHTPKPPNYTMQCYLKDDNKYHTCGQEVTEFMSNKIVEGD